MTADARSDMDKITCVLSSFLGNRTYSIQLGDAVDRCVGESRKLWFDLHAYQNHRAPWWLRHISALEGLHVASRWLREVDRRGVFVINGFGLAMALDADAMVVATDTTPAMMARMSRRFHSTVINSIVSLRFRRTAYRVRAWLPVSEACRRSLVEDYGVQPDCCLVTRCPQSVVDPTPHEPSGSILFVGNDFARKGGPELLRVFQRNLLPNCRLTVVSNDPSLAGHSPGNNVRIVAGLTSPSQIAECYRDADLLVLPTRFDVYSYVICEAASHEVPALATRVGAVGELLDESGGASLTKGCTAEEIASAIKEALGASYMMRARSAAQFALRELSIARFDQRVMTALRMT